jgi:hypothetical protein
MGARTVARPGSARSQFAETDSHSWARTQEPTWPLQPGRFLAGSTIHPGDHRSAVVLGRQPGASRSVRGGGRTRFYSRHGFAWPDREAMAFERGSCTRLADDRLAPLRRRGHPRRAYATGGDAVGAAAGDQLVLGHPHRHRGQVEHLPPLHPHLGRIRQIRAAAAAGTRLMPQPLVRIGDLRQCRPRMPLLPTRLSPAPAPQRLRSGLAERRVRRRGHRGIRRVHTQPPLEISVLRPQSGDLSPKLLDHRRLTHDQGGKLVIRRTPIPSLHTKIISRATVKPQKRPDQLRR